MINLSFVVLFLVNIFNALRFPDYSFFRLISVNLKLFPPLKFCEGKVRAVASSAVLLGNRVIAPLDMFAIDMIRDFVV